MPVCTGETAATASSFAVSVPVLSAQSTSIVAASCKVESRVSSTPFFASDWAPSAAASVNVAGNATGTAESSAVSTRGTSCDALRPMMWA